VKRAGTKKKTAAKSKKAAKNAAKRVTRKVAKKAPRGPARKPGRKASPKVRAKATRKAAKKLARKAAARAKTKTVGAAAKTKSAAQRRTPSSGQTKLVPKTAARPRHSLTPVRSAFAQDLQARAGLSPLSNAVLNALSDLDLAGHAKDGAQVLMRAHPAVVFTSGRRSVQQQADAMAGNVVGNRNWIRDTYAESPERYELQTWVESHPDATTRDQIMAGLRTVMNGWNDARKMRLSRHFAGLAFDVQPVVGAVGEAIKATIRALPHLRRFLDSEGGKIIWHAEFRPR
jgi:hypothetical protein